VSGEFFSFDRLEQTVQNGPNTSAEAMVNHLRLRLEAFCGDRELHDDLTMIVVRVR
jgi:serine phosphatase RsbU (regulator of sigma subunit)